MWQHEERNFNCYKWCSLYTYIHVMQTNTCNDGKLFYIKCHIIEKYIYLRIYIMLPNSVLCSVSGDCMCQSIQLMCFTMSCWKRVLSTNK